MSSQPAPRPTEREEATEALVGGDVGFRPGSIRAAMAHPEFRRVWTGSAASNVGSWMQNLVLMAFAYELTESPAYVGLVAFAQLGPTLFLSVLGGVLADMVDRRRLLLAAQIEQMAFAFVLALVARGSDPSESAVVVCVFAIGVGWALNGPAYSSLLPELVGREHVAGAVSLHWAQMNVARVIGPAIGGVLYPAFGPGAIFAINGATYIFAIAAIATVRLPQRPAPENGQDDERRGLHQVLAGFRIARADPLIRRILITMTLFSFFSLPFLGLMPALAAENLDMRPRSLAYGLLYAGFGFGAAAGAVSIGSSLAELPKARVVRAGLGGFTVLLAAFGLVRHGGAAYPIALVLGFSYFTAVTALATVLQEHLEDRVRGRITSLWMMAFGGMVPLGTLAAGRVADATSVTVVLLIGAVVAVALTWYCDLERV